MFCYKCGKQLDDGSQFCVSCGAVLSRKSESVKTENMKTGNTVNSDDSEKFSKLYIDKNEKVVSFLGSSYVMNYLNSGELKEGACLLTDKRIYYKGKSYKKSGEHLIKNKEETIVDVKDITASGFTESVNTGLLIKSWILLILTLFIFLAFPSPIEVWEDIADHFNYAIIYIVEAILIVFTIINFVKYSLQRVKLFYIAFAGGTLAFKATDYSYRDIHKFNRSLRKVINNIK